MARFDATQVRIVTGWVALTLLVLGVYRMVQPFLEPLVWAAILAVFFRRLHGVFLRRLRRPNLAALATVIAVLLLLIVPLAFLLPRLVRETAAFLSAVSNGDALARLRAVFEQYWARSPVPLGNLQDVLDDFTSQFGGRLAQVSAQVAGNVATFVFQMTVMLFALFYMLRDGRRIVSLLRSLMPWGLEQRNQMIRQTADLVQVTMSSTFITAAVQGALGGVIYWALGLPSPVLWGAVMALMAFLPLIGPWMVWAPTAIALLASGQTARGIALLVLGFLVVSGADNVLRPVLIAGRTQLNGLLVFISVLGGIQAMGFVGVVLGPLLMATAVGLLRGYSETVPPDGEVR
jgi:predicted PurR-regulated permease PerM